jgi:hypothetical protein
MDTLFDESSKQAAQEYLVTRPTEDGLTYQEKLNRDAAIALAPAVWKQVVQTVVTKCNEWNAVPRRADPQLQGDRPRSIGLRTG